MKRILLLSGGDLLAFLLFVWIGRSSHALSLTDVRAVLETAAPFVIGWFVVAPWFGLFGAEVSRSGRKLTPRLVGAWVLIGGPIALLLRNIFLGRPVLEGTVPTFALVTMGVTTLFLLIWRLGYSWWSSSRRLDQEETVQGL